MPSGQTAAAAPITQTRKTKYEPSPSEAAPIETINSEILVCTIKMPTARRFVSRPHGPATSPTNCYKARAPFSLRTTRKRTAAHLEKSLNVRNQLGHQTLGHVALVAAALERVQGGCGSVAHVLARVGRYFCAQ